MNKLLENVLSILPGVNEVMIVKGIKKRNKLEKENGEDIIQGVSKEYNQSYIKHAGRIVLAPLYLGYGGISYNQSSLNPNDWKSGEGKNYTYQKSAPEKEADSTKLF